MLGYLALHFLSHSLCLSVCLCLSFSLYLSSLSKDLFINILIWQPCLIWQHCLWQHKTWSTVWRLSLLYIKIWDFFRQSHFFTLSEGSRGTLYCTYTRNEPEIPVTFHCPLPFIRKEKSPQPPICSHRAHAIVPVNKITFKLWSKWMKGAWKINQLGFDPSLLSLIDELFYVSSPDDIFEASVRFEDKVTMLGAVKHALSGAT